MVYRPSFARRWSLDINLRAVNFDLFSLLSFFLFCRHFHLLHCMILKDFSVKIKAMIGLSLTLRTLQCRGQTIWTSAEKRHAQLMRGDKYDKALYCLWDLPQSKSMNVRYAARYSPQPSS